jgi:two-component system, OmpR family, sensor histidine kinase KdpD
LQAGKLPIHPESRSIDDVVAIIQAQLQVLGKHHHFKVEMSTDLPLIFMDVQRIAQVLVNLVGNAVKFSPPDTTIRIEAALVEDRVQVSVSDEGEGIVPEARAYIFEAFRQADHGSRRFKGAGLGLAICKGLIEAHGGRIWVQDRPLPGTTICFTLPVTG